MSDRDKLATIRRAYAGALPPTDVWRALAQLGAYQAWEEWRLREVPWCWCWACDRRAWSRRCACGMLNRPFLH